MRILAVIPARGGSKRLPGKNTRQLFDKPLIAWTIDFAKSTAWFTDVQVSTDSPEIAAVCEQYGVAVPRLRPAGLATDEAGTLEVVLDVLQWQRSLGQEFDALALLQPTSPVRIPARWDLALKILEKGDCDAVIGVAPALTHPFLVFKEGVDGSLQPWVPNPAAVMRSQDYPPAYAVNGALYLIKVSALLEQKTFFPKKCFPVVCSEPVENIDIDTAYDWRLAEMTIADWMAEQ